MSNGLDGTMYSEHHSIQCTVYQQYDWEVSVEIIANYCSVAPQCQFKGFVAAPEEQKQCILD